MALLNRVIQPERPLAPCWQLLKLRFGVLQSPLGVGLCGLLLDHGGLSLGELFPGSAVRLLGRLQAMVVCCQRLSFSVGGQAGLGVFDVVLLA